MLRSTADGREGRLLTFDSNDDVGVPDKRDYDCPRGPSLATVDNPPEMTTKTTK